MKRKFISIFLCLSLVLGSVSAPISAKEQDSENKAERTQAIEKLNTLSNGALKLTDNGGQVLISGKLSNKETPGSGSASKFLEDNKSIFGINNTSDELKVIDIKKDEIGDTFVKYQQEINGIKVNGSKLSIHFDKDGIIRSVNGKLEKNKKITTLGTLHITENDAIEIAKKQFDYKSLRGTPKAEKLILNKNNNNYEAYMVNISYTEPTIGNYDVYVEAHSGKVIQTESNIRHDGPVTGTGIDVQGNSRTLNLYQYGNSYQMKDLTRSYAGGILTFDARHGTSTGYLVSNSSNYFSDENSKASVSAHYNAGKVLDFYKILFGRNSLDGNGMAISSYTHYSTNYNNAFWDGYEMVYGDGDSSNFTYLSGDMDVVGHEMTHGVISNTANLDYHNQSGALNESIADTFGVLIETYNKYNVANGGTWLFNTADWVVGDDIYTPYISGDALRSLSNPTLYNQPDNMSGYQKLPDTDTGDNGGVHVNSGITNKAAYLIAKSIGMEKTARIYYRALLYYMNMFTDFQGARDSLVQAATDLYGINSDAVSAVTNSFISVGIGQLLGDDSYEPNDTIQTAYQINLGTTYQSYIYRNTDVDYYKVNVSYPGELNISLSNLPDNYDLDVYDSNGYIIGYSRNVNTGPGSVNINASAGSSYYIKVYSNGDYSTTQKYSLVVKKLVTGVALDKTYINLKVGKSTILKATVIPTDATNSKVNWSTSNNSVATVDNAGNVTAIGNGTATITATTVDGSKTATCSIGVGLLTITFNTNGGSAVSSQITGYDTKITEPTAPTKSGYVFGGWYKEAACTNAWNFAEDRVTSDITLYAKWTETTQSSKELKVSSALTQWVLDEPTNTLYTISQTGKNLVFVNASTMAVEKSIILNGNPTDIIIDDGKLYIAIDNIHQIDVVDMSSRTITETLYTSSDPYRIVKDGDKIFYTTFDQWCSLYEYNLTSKSEQSLSVGFVYNPDIAINPSNHMLYIGESGSSGSNITYYSTIDKKVIGKSNYDDGYGFPYPSRYTIFDGTNVYYAGRDFNADDPRIFNGDFGNGESVIYVNNGLVYTTKSIYDKDTHVKLGDYGYSASLIVASNNTLYIYNNDNGSVKSFNDSNNVINSKNVISLISGVPAASVQNNTQSKKTNAATSDLEMRSKLIQWVLDEPSNTLYGISKDDKALFFVNATTLNLEKSLIFASSPTDIIQDQGKLYVALDDVNQIAIIDTGSRSITGKLYTSSDPYRIVKDGNKIYYTERDQWCYIYEYNLTTNVDLKTSLGIVYNPDLDINTNDHILYVGESGLSGSTMYYYSTVDNKVIARTSYNGGYGFPYPSRNIVFDGEKVYYAGFGFDKLNPTRILGNYGDTIIFAKYGLAFSNTRVYDSESYTVIKNYDTYTDLYEVSEQGVSYYYRTQEGSILRIDPNKIVSVQFNSQGGSEVGDITAYIGDLIVAPAAPTRTGYTFGGWYKEAECINAWDFASDKVTENITLYAKWTASVYSVILNKTAISLEIGGTDTLIATVDPTEAVNKSVRWSSNNTAVTTVDSTGKVTALGAGSAVITVTTVDGNKTASCTVTVNSPKVQMPSVLYQGHVENIGWQSYVKDGALAGTEGRALRIEALRVKLENAPAGLRIKYKTHVENIGWQDWVYDNAMAGTQGQALRVEALQIMLEGTNAEQYTVEYQAHVENEGWQTWVRDGQIAGTFGKCQRVEAVRIRIVEKVPSVLYQGHVENIGWQSYVKDGALAGTEGRALRIEALRVKLENAPAGLRIKYKTHVENIGWQDWVYDNAMAGTQGQALRVEALQIMLEGTNAEQYIVQYQAHVENEGWQTWVRDGQIAGTFGKAQRIEAVRIVIIRKN